VGFVPSANLPSASYWKVCDNHVLTVDYCEGWVQIEPPQKLSAPGPQLGDNAKLPVPLAFR
jgi:hypothetical protein